MHKPPSLEEKCTYKDTAAVCERVLVVWISERGFLSGEIGRREWIGTRMGLFETLTATSVLSFILLVRSSHAMCMDGLEPWTEETLFCPIQVFQAQS